MQTQEFHELKEIIDRIEGKVDTMALSLKSCQTRCHVDNPPKGWKKFVRALTSSSAVIF